MLNNIEDKIGEVPSATEDISVKNNINNNSTNNSSTNATNTIIPSNNNNIQTSSVSTPLNSSYFDNRSNTNINNVKKLF